jgi:hypothetical protein
MALILRMTVEGPIKRRERTFRERGVSIPRSSFARGKHAAMLSIGSSLSASLFELFPQKCSSTSSVVTQHTPIPYRDESAAPAGRKRERRTDPYPEPRLVSATPLGHPL